MSEVYKSYAFTENEREKAKSNRARYEEIKSKWNILCRGYAGIREAEDLTIYDLIIVRKPEYHHSICKVIENKTDLTQDEIALVCDGGNLCFGYRMQGEDFYIFED